MKKKTAMIVSLAVGTLMFTTTAFAEVVSKSGYDQAKEAMKYSADNYTSKLSSYTVDVSFALKDNGTVISSQNSVNKYDLKKLSCENTTTTVEGKEKNEGFYYRDKAGYISYNNKDGIYHVTEQKINDDKFWINNPFKQKEAGDLEKIADAFIGNLKDSVVASDNSDGSKEFSGSLNEAQIPTLANAIVSYQLKRQFGFYSNNQNNPNNQDNKSLMPKITQDIFVKDLKGKMTVDKNGLVQNILGTGVLYGKDDAGKEHSLTFEVLAKAYDVNKTVINKPDLNGKKVEKTVIEDNTKISNPELYIGTYKNNIFIKKDGKFKKIGERVVSIDKITEKNISGSYSEEYLKGYEDYAAKAKSFKFNAVFDKNIYNANFTYTNSEGKNIKGNIGMNYGFPRLYFDFDNARSGVSADGNAIFDGEFDKVID